MSPSDTDGNPAFQYIGGGLLAVATDDSVLLGGGAIAASNAASGSNPYYVATRGPGGWTASSILPATIGGGETYDLLDATPSLSGAVFEVSSSAQLSGASPGQEVPIRLVYRAQGGAFSTLVTIAPAEQNTESFDYGGMSADGQTVVYDSTLTPGGAAADGGEEAYAWHPGSGASAIGGQPGGPLAGCGAKVIQGTNTVSADGQTAFLYSGAGGAAGCPVNPQLFVSSGGQTREISAPLAGTPTSPGPAAFATFVAATPDGRTAYFTTSEPLTPDAVGLSGQELYRWTADATGTGRH